MRNALRNLLSALVLLATAAASAQPQVGARAPAALDSLVRAYAAEHGLPSVVVGVVVGGQRTVVGLGEVNGVAPDAHTLYEIGSISKVLTSLALADAVVQGETTLETPVADLLPGATVGAHADGPIRLVDLATHTSGLPQIDLSMGFVPGFDLADPYVLYGPDHLLAFLAGVTPPTAPGAAFGYSNLGAGLLGYALAQRAGTSYADLVGQRVLAPLGLTETWPVVPDSLAARFAEGHGVEGEPVPHWTFGDATAGAGGWRSSAADMLTLAEAALDPSTTPLADALDLALTPHAEASRDRQIGLGWFLLPVPEADGVTMAFHNGGTGGFRSFLAAVPGHDVAVVVLTNRIAEVDALGVELVQRLVAAGE